MSHQKPDNHNNSRYRLVVDRKRCISAATCVALAPDTFQLDEQDIATVVDDPQDSNQDQLLAAKSCPVGAITVIDRKSGEQIYP